MTPSSSDEILVVGLGSENSGDDACGLEVARTLARTPLPGVQVTELAGDLTRLLDLWQGRALVIVVDAVRSSQPPGSIERLNLTNPGFERAARSLSTHGLSLWEAIGLSTTLGQMPERLVLYGISAARLETGDSLSAPVAAAIPETARQIVDEVTSRKRD